MTPRSRSVAVVAFAHGLCALLAPRCSAGAVPHPSTFSIVAADPASGEVGVAVASRFFAVGAVVPFAKAGVGAVATQASAIVSYGPRTLELVARGVTPSFEHLGRSGSSAPPSRG